MNPNMFLLYILNSVTVRTHIYKFDDEHPFRNDKL